MLEYRQCEAEEIWFRWYGAVRSNTMVHKADGITVMAVVITETTGSDGENDNGPSCICGPVSSLQQS